MIETLTIEERKKVSIYCTEVAKNYALLLEQMEKLPGMGMAIEHTLRKVAAYNLVAKEIL